MTVDQFTISLWSQLQEKLDEIPKNGGNKLQHLQLCFEQTELTIAKLKEFVLKYEFNDEEEEIRFFKEIKPKFESTLFYYAEVFTVESDRPIAGKKVQKQYLLKKQEIVYQFLKSQQHLHNYIKLNRSDSDGQYFLRKNFNHEKRPNGICSSLDERFSTVHSYLVSKIKAYIEVNSYLQKEIKFLGRATAEDSPDDPRLVWTAPKVHLIELIYALKVAGVFNNGSAEIKEIAEGLSRFFPQRLKDYYRTFQEIRIRKKSRTVFLDSLKDNLVQSMEKAESFSDMTYP
ncbi:hypothetical protein A33Q_0899 [Indibacter alkaliphilus LW1]|uniref:RteC protein n=1 Tax=Indibacter alkaliphilus (strain CCUG 57479 / KCTC 22604 / LW1) TaxID=1189612 RepID=S2E343_INDAL|nr:RteC domain-containing protein [Indibacter alkaliphilus]EOZ98916.1 hypothetical protein A33Q_0899 [Indibacter alkaliphilus LW1]